jgi:hypothetical protein
VKPNASLHHFHGERAAELLLRHVLRKQEP